MGEIKQANFRIDKEHADAFRRFCEESHFSQAQGFAYLMRFTDPSSTEENAEALEALNVEKIIDAVKAAAIDTIEEKIGLFMKDAAALLSETASLKEELKALAAASEKDISSGSDADAVHPEKMTDSRWQQLHYETAKENASLKKQIAGLKEENERLKKFRNQT